MRTQAIVVLLGMGLSVPAIRAGEPPRPFEVVVEAGPVWQSKNDVQIPNDDSGDRFALAEVTGNGPWTSFRVEFLWDIRPRHGLRVLVAPLSFTEDGELSDTVRFAGETFDPDSPVEATYQFDSWRATYRYRLKDGPQWRWWVGATLKVRDARIRLQQGSAVGEDTDVGVVPLLCLRGEWRFADRWNLLLDFDGLAGGPGRAFDVSAQVRRSVGDRWMVGGGYRTLEGGADVEDVYGFAWFHYAVVSAAVRF